MVTKAVLPAEKPTCLFCAGDDGTVPAGEILAKTAAGYLIQAARRDGERLVPDDGHWLVIPWAHVTEPSSMPRNWDSAEADLLAAIPDFRATWPDYPAHVIYYLFGTQVGQTQLHRHGHIRISGEDGIKLQLGGV